jgi:hypothetical protein
VEPAQPFGAPRERPLGDVEILPADHAVDTRSRREPPIAAQQSDGLRLAGLVLGMMWLQASA